MLTSGTLFSIINPVRCASSSGSILAPAGVGHHRPPAETERQRFLQLLRQPPAGGRQAAERRAASARRDKRGTNLTTSCDARDFTNRGPVTGVTRVGEDD